MAAFKKYIYLVNWNSLLKLGEDYCELKKDHCMLMLMDISCLCVPHLLFFVRFLRVLTPVTWGSKGGGRCMLYRLWSVIVILVFIKKTQLQLVSNGMQRPVLAIKVQTPVWPYVSLTAYVSNQQNLQEYWAACPIAACVWCCCKDDWACLQLAPAYQIRKHKQSKQSQFFWSTLCIPIAALALTCGYIWSL